MHRFVAGMFAILGYRNARHNLLLCAGFARQSNDADATVNERQRAMLYESLRYRPPMAPRTAVVSPRLKLRNDLWHDVGSAGGMIVPS